MPTTQPPRVYETAAQRAVSLMLYRRVPVSCVSLAQNGLDVSVRSSAEVRKALDWLVEHGLARRTRRGRYVAAAPAEVRAAIPLDPETYRFRVTVESPGVGPDWQGTGNWWWRERLSRDEAEAALEQALVLPAGAGGQVRTAVQLEEVDPAGERTVLRRWERLPLFREVPLGDSGPHLA